MIESLRIFGILLYKSWLVHKKQIIGTLFKEMLMPIGLVALIWAATGSFSEAPEKIDYDSYYKMQSLDELVAGDEFYNATIFAAPKTKPIYILMDHVNKCLKNKDKYSTELFPNESMLLEHYYRQGSILGLNPMIGVVFNKYTKPLTKHLRYKLRYMSLGEAFHDKINATNFYTSRQPFAQIQMCIDRSFVKQKNSLFPNLYPLNHLPDMYIQQMPYPAHTKYTPFTGNSRNLFIAILYIAFIFPLFVETAKSSGEKFSGVHVLMSMNRISNTLNLLSWIFSGILLLSIIFILPILLMLTRSPGDGTAFMHFGNPFILFLILIFHLIHFLIFGIHVCSYFNRATFVTIAIAITLMVGIVLKVEALDDSTIFLAPYLGILFPGILFVSAFEEIIKYEIKAEGIHWYNLFMNANPHVEIGGSVGMILLFFVIGWFCHFSLAIYISAIHPGKYGVAKDLLFCLKFKSKQNNNDDDVENFEYDDSNDQFFESTSLGVYIPGIQIRNLKKSYNVSLFSNKKVDALRGVSIDFYKGQITSLLGHNGAGKTTMMSIITGMISPSDGLVLINGKSLKDNACEIMNDMGLCPQADMYFSNLTVSEQLTFFAMLKRKDKSKSEIRQDVSDLLKKLKILDKEDAIPGNLSGGQKRRVCLGMALIGDPSILILDEPTSGLDPETSRVIWDTLLKLRGEKTIVISTHNMEEADILGDRIAIMHTGQLKSYGTSLFLKRLLGQNSVEITLSIEPGSDPQKIRTALHKDGTIVSSEPGKIVVRIPNSPGLPDILDNLEKKKKELRVSGFSVSLMSLEQVYLRMTEDDNDTPEPRAISEEVKLTGKALLIQTVRVLLSKKLTYARKDYHTIYLKFLMIILGIFMYIITMVGIDKLPTSETETISVGLHMYPKADVTYTSYNKTIGDQYKAISKSFKGNPIEVTNRNLESALLHRAKDNLAIYDNYMIAAAELNDTAINAFYSGTALFSLPISINLVSNVITKCILGNDYSISTYMQGWPSEIFTYLDTSIGSSTTTSFLFTSIFGAMVALYIRQPRSESATGFKQLQMMTGVSGFIYWGTAFIIDIIEYILLVVLIMFSVLIADWSLKLRIYGPTEIAIHALLFVLFGVNTLLLTYNCSFLNMKENSLVSMLTYAPIGIVTMNLIMYLLSLAVKEKEGNFLQNYYSIQNAILQLLPNVSFFHAQLSFLYIALSNARCLKLPNDFYDIYCSFRKEACCGLKCYDGKCEKSMPYFEDYHFGNLEESLTYLLLTPIIYIVVLVVLESRFIPKIFIKLKNINSKHYAESNDDEPVQREKSMVRERIQTLSSNNQYNDEMQKIEDTDNLSYNPVFLVYELQKSYKSVKAVKDISFGVNRRECFGLLGVNGAGKSTTFRMMTGAEFPDHGVMYIGNKDFKNHEKYYLSQMTYCPQNDAILDNLNSYDHLRFFAQLRGIAVKNVANEIEAWIERLNLTACASQPSGTYSGGNKRRLNIAIALIGNPNLVFMDEPTTGVDPRARRSLWNVIKTCQMAGQTFILASHSMEECEALCNRLTIMAAGKLMCIGASEELKQRFGAGYDIQMKLDPEKDKDQIDAIKAEVEKALRCELVDENRGYLMYHVEAGTTWRKMYDVMNGMKSKYDCIEDFSVLSSSLEQLFLLFARTVGNSPAQN